MKTPAEFVNKYMGQAYAESPSLGVQCVFGFKIWCRWAGVPVLPTPNNWADGYWIFRDSLGFAQWFDYITDTSQMQDGDWVIWGKDPSRAHCPQSHIAMYYHGQFFGQRQGTPAREFCLKSIPFEGILGALRWKEWSVMASITKGINEITYKSIPFYVVKGYKDTNGMDFRQLYMLSAWSGRHGNPLRAIQPITEFDSNQMYILAVSNANYFEMANQKDYGMHYGVEQSDGDGANSQPIDFALKSNRDLLVFYQKKDGICGYTTADRYNYKKDDVIFACSPYSIRFHNCQMINERSLCFTNKELTPTMITAYCLTCDGTWNIIVSRKVTTPDVVANLMREMDTREGFIVDGGGSTQLVYIGKAYINTLRQIPNVLVLGCFKKDIELLEPYKEEEKEIPADVDTAEVEALRLEINEYKQEVESLQAKISKAKEALS